MKKDKSVRENGAKDKILAAIRRAAEELGRAPSRGELRRITGVSHYRVLAEFRTLREAARAAGLEPSRKGEKISTGELLKDWNRVRRKLGKRPSRSEYVREGRYSAGAFVGRFGSWGNISTTEDAENHREGKTAHRGDAETRRRSKPGNHKGHEGTQRECNGEPVLHSFACAPLARVPGPLEGKRRVTEAVAQLVVNTLLGERSGDLVIRTWGDRRDAGALQRHATGQAQGNGNTGRVRKDRPVMGEPFDRSPMTNAPVNELGVVLLFGMVVVSLGFQVEWVQGRMFPDCQAKREVAPGKWQHVRIEFEYESKNFLLHGHDPKRCDVIVCWRHNWKECPEEIEVVELCRLFGQN